MELQRRRPFRKLETWKGKIPAAYFISARASHTCTIFRRIISPFLIAHGGAKVFHQLRASTFSQRTIRADGAISHRSAHTGGVNMMMVDTSTRFVADSVNEDLWKAVATPKGSETLSEDL